MKLVRIVTILIFFSLGLWSILVQPVGAQEPVIYPIHLPIIHHETIFDPIIETFIQEVQPSRLFAYTENLVLNFSPRNHGFYRIYIDADSHLGPQIYSRNNLLRSLADTQERFIQMGYSVTLETVADVYGGGYNIVARKPAIQPNPSSSVIEVGAHIDAWKSWDSGASTPGASDNAVSVAGLLEMAALLKDYPNSHPWQFVVFVSEERGRWGSKLHADRVKSQPFKAALIMDGIGWSEIEPEYMNCSWAFDNLPESVRLAGLIDLVRYIYAIPIGWRRCSASSQTSDHFSYYEEGLPSILSIGGIPYGGQNYHSRNDNLTNLNLRNAVYTLQENIGVLLTLDNEP